MVFNRSSLRVFISQILTDHLLLARDDVLRLSSTGFPGDFEIGSYELGTEGTTE